MINENGSIDTVAVAKRYFGPKATGSKVDCMEREFDGRWEMIKLMQDPTLEKEQLDQLRDRKIPIPYRWVTVEVVDPYVVLGILKSINKAEAQQ